MPHTFNSMLELHHHDVVGITEIEMNTMGQMFEEVEQQLLKQFKSITPEQHAEEELKRQMQREWEAAHTPIETDADRANTDEYPEDDDEVAA